jgi:Flp pilus assembly protein TadG
MSLVGRFRGRRFWMRAQFLRAKRVRQFRRDSDGATAVEFAIVAVPFFALVFAIIETALVFFAGQVLETGVSEGARIVRTGQVQQQGLDENAFRARVCSGMAGLFNCESGLKLDVRTYQSFDGIDLSKPIDGDGNLVENFTYEPGAGGDIVVVRAFYEWPTFVPGFGNDLADLANGKRLLAGAAAFRNEPF